MADALPGGTIEQYPGTPYGQQSRYPIGPAAREPHGRKEFNQEWPTHRMLGSTVGSFADQPSARSPVTESTIERTNTRERWILGGLSVLLFLVFLFIYTHELTAHVRFFCRAANVAMLPHDARVRLPILKNQAPTASMSYMSAVHDGDS
jgi:hypothetical protein